MSKVKIVGIFLLAICLSFLYPAPTTEAAPNPDVILAKLQARLDAILSDATSRKNELSDKVTTWINRYNSGKISQNKFCSELDSLQEGSNNARDKFDRKINKQAQRTINKLQNIGADPSYTTTAEGKRDTALTKNDTLYDAVDTEIDDGKQSASPWCT